MKNLIFVLIFLVPTTLLMAQKGENNGMNDSLDLNKPNDQLTFIQSVQTMQRGSFLQSFDFRYSGVRGTRYFVDDFCRGELWMKDKRHFNQKDMVYKFDELENAILVRYSTGKELLLDAKDVLRFRLDVLTDSVTYFSSIVPNSSSQEVKMFQIIYAGNSVRLIKVPQKKLVRVENTGAYTTSERYDELQDVSRYFVKIGEKPFVEIGKPTKKRLLAAMPSKKAKLRNLFEDVPKFANTNLYDDILLAEIAREVDVKKTDGAEK